jgi:hypothetical protein
MITTILTLDESRKKIQSVIDQNSKKVVENHNNPKKSTLSKFEPKQIVLEYHKMKSTILTLDESRTKLKGAFHGEKGYQGNRCRHHQPTPPRLPILLLFWGTVFPIRVTLGYQYRAQGTHLPLVHIVNLLARETLPKSVLKIYENRKIDENQWRRPVHKARIL